MTDGCKNIDHQPVVFTASSGRNDDTNNPNVGIVQKKTNPYTSQRPGRLLSVALIDRPIGSPPITVSAAFISTNGVVTEMSATVMLPSTPRLGAGRGG